MVEIIPKPIKRALEWQKITFYLALGLFMAAVLALAVLWQIESRAFNKLEDLEDKIGGIGTAEEKIKEREVLYSQKQIRDFADLFEAYQKSSQFFEFLEAISHPKVWFSKTELNFEKREAVLSGQAQSFQVLGQQLLIFQKESALQNVELTSLNIDKEGQVGFSFNLSFDPQVLKSNERGE